MASDPPSIMPSGMSYGSRALGVQRPVSERVEPGLHVDPPSIMPYGSRALGVQRPEPERVEPGMPVVLDQYEEAPAPQASPFRQNIYSSPPMISPMLSGRRPTIPTATKGTTPYSLGGRRKRGTKSRKSRKSRRTKKYSYKRSLRKR